MAMFNKLHNLSVKASLIGAFGLLSLMLVIGAVAGLEVMSQQNNAMSRSYDQAIGPARMLGDLRSKALLDFTVLGEAAQMVDRPDQMKQKVAESRKIESATDAINKKLDAVPMDEKSAGQYKQFLDLSTDYRSDVEDVYAALADGYQGTGAMIEMQLRPQLMMRLSALDKLIQAQGEKVQGIYQAQVDRYHVVRIVVLIGLIVGLAIAALVSFTLIRSLSQTLSYLGKVAYAISEGRLGHYIKVERKDEFGHVLDAFRVMDERLITIVGEVRKGSDAIGGATEQIRSGNEGLSERTQEQASSLVETASAMEEMTSTVKQNADNANHANELAHSAGEQAEKGGEVVREAVAAMAEVDASSSKISDIVRLIEEIATQTNLLALNAAVEAARAGEQGRGFAVVAAEVRNLAQRSADAAKEIKTLITESEDNVHAGSALVNQSGEALSGIVESVKKVTDMVAEIATASHEQSVGIDQVSHAVTQIEEMTQQNSTMVEEASTASRALQEQAAELARQVSFFQLGDADARKTPPRHISETERATAAVFEAIRKGSPEARAEARTEVDDWEEF